MKKLGRALMLIGVSLVVLVACGDDAQETATNNKTEATPTVEATEVTRTNEVSDNESADVEGEIVLSILLPGWAGEEELEQRHRMLQGFMNRYPHIYIDILEVPLNPDGSGGDYGEFLNTLAARGELPDVFMYFNVPLMAARGWAYDARELTSTDPEFANVVPVLTEGGTIDGRVYGLPMQMFIRGMFINLDIFEELNVEPLGFSYTVQDLRAAIAATTTDTFRGIGELAIENWGPFVLGDLGYFTFDGRNMNFTDPVFAEIVEIQQDIIARNQSGHTRFVSNDTWAPDGVGWPLAEGYIALASEFSWALSHWAADSNNPMSNRNNIDLLPLPNETIIANPDFLFMASTTNHPQEAYELVRWMTFGIEGQLYRLDLIVNEGLHQWPGVPITPGHIPAIDEFFAQTAADFPNFARMYQSLFDHPENVFVEGGKVIPGFNMARSYADTGLIGTVNGEERSMTIGQLLTAIMLGERQLADYAAEIERIANVELQNAREELGLE